MHRIAAMRMMGKMMVMLETLKVVITSSSLDPALGDIFTKPMDLKASGEGCGHTQ